PSRLDEGDLRERLGRRGPECTGRGLRPGNVRRGRAGAVVRVSTDGARGDGDRTGRRADVPVDLRLGMVHRHRAVCPKLAVDVNVRSDAIDAPVGYKDAAVDALQP